MTEVMGYYFKLGYRKNLGSHLHPLLFAYTEGSHLPHGELPQGEGHMEKL